MIYDEARAHILAAIDKSSPMLNDPAIARRLADPRNEIAFEDLGFDSLTAMEICLTLEDATGQFIEPGDLLLYPGINALAAFMCSGQARSAA
jgi:acyl carrier protein